MSTTLPLFWHLSSSSKKERVDASVKLIGALEQFQAQFVPKNISDTPSGSEPDEEEDEEEGTGKSDGLDAVNAQDVSYSIRRLVRGLASPRESSRLGFAVALTELLSRIHTVACSQIIALIIDGSKTQGSMSGQEERDVLFARLFGLSAVIQSGLLVRGGSLDTSASSTTQASTLEAYNQTIVELLALGEKKSWLRESAWWTISLGVDALNDSDIDWKEDAVGFTLQQLFVENKAWSPEKVALTLKLQDLYPDRDWPKFLSPPFKNANLLYTGNLHLLARILKESSMDEEDANPKASTRSWKPQLHFVWDIILDQLIPSQDSSRQPKGSFQEFYRAIVDESLFSSTSSPERKYWGFQVFQKALPRCTQANMPMLFTQNFMRSWINHLSHHDRHLHKIATQAATEVQTFVQSNPHLGFALILQLTGVNGSQQFDKLTKTKTVESILTSMDAEGVKNYIDYLLTQVNTSEDNEKADSQTIKTRRIWIMEQLGALIRGGNIPKSDEWIQSILDWLVIHGLFVVKKKSGKGPFPALKTLPSPPFSDDLRQACRARLLGCLGDLNSQITVVRSGEKTTKVPAVATDGELWVAKVLATIQALEHNGKHVSLLNKPDENEVVLRTRALDIAARLKLVSQESAKGVEFLLLGTVLQQYCQEPEEIDSDALEACIDGASRMFADGKEGKNVQRSSIGSKDATLEPIDVFVDIIIGFLEKSTTYLRTVSNQVFSLLSGSVRDTTIDLILGQLERRDPAELAEDTDADADEEMDEDDETEEALVQSDSEDPETGSEDDDDEDVDVELRNRIVEALQGSGIDATSDNSDDEGELMNDEQMMAIDEQLAQVFRSRANEKKSGKNIDAQREATHFKNRVLDLVDTFVKKQPSSPHIIRLIPTLADLIVGTSPDERQLSDKAKGIVRSRIGKSKELPSGVDIDRISTVLNDVHMYARRAHSSDLLATLSQCSIYLSRTLLHMGAEQSLLQVYRPSLKDFITRKNSALNANFFQEFIRRCPTSAWNLRGDLLDLSIRAVNLYRQSQAYQLLELLVNQLPVIGDVDQAEILDFLASLKKSLLMTTSSACDEGNGLTTSQMKDLLKLGIVAIRHTQRIDRTLCQDIWQPDSWRVLCGRLAASRFKSSPALQKMCEQLINLAQATPSSKSSIGTDLRAHDSTKRKAVTVSEEETTVQVKKPKRAKSKETKRH